MKNLNFFCALIFTVVFASVANAQLDCTNAALVSIGRTIQGNTTNGRNNVSTYNNDPWWQLTGPEIVHKLEWAGGQVSIKLSNKSAALDLILLRSCNNNDFVASGGGNSGTVESTITRALDAGTYYIVVDGWQLARGTYNLLVTQTETITINGVVRNFSLRDSTLYELTGTTSQVLATGVESFNKYWGYVTNTTTGDGQQQDVLAIKKFGQTKPKVFLNGNFDTDYVKQMLFCQQKTLSLNGDLVFDGNTQILSGCDVLRCENGQILAHQANSQIKLYSNLGTNNWLDIAQIITVNNTTYYIKQSDNTVWAINAAGNQATSIGTGAKLLQDNDNQLIKIDPQGNYQRWNGANWSNLTPKYVGISPEMVDDGFWFFMQSKPLLESTNIQADQKKALTFGTNDVLQMELIPATGNCDRFLWRTKDVGGGKRLLINMAKGENFPLLVSASGALTFATGQGVKEWDIKQSDITKYGTNAYQLTGANAAKTLSFSNTVQTESPSVGNKNQTWVFQFNQMVKDYFLPLPTRANLDLYYLDNPNVNLNTSASAIGAAYNKFLKGTNGVTVFATNTSSDWAIVNYYFTINNMMNAVIKPKPSDVKVDPNLIKTLDAMKGQSLILINKNDLNSAVPTQFFLVGGLSVYDMGRLRGSAGYLASKKWILASEELTNKTGIVNRPLDKTFRRFDHGVHEFTHALQQLCNWIAIIDSNNMCNAERNRSSECFCFDTQNWFNSNAPNYTYPGLRAYTTQRADFMKKIFSEANTWMPPVDLRLDGYNPSGPASIISSIISLDNSPLLNFEVYPNPTSSEITIKGNLSEMKEIEVEITDVLGRVVCQKKLQPQQLSFSYSVSELGAKPAGTYFVKLTTGNFSKSSVLYKL
jgi:Secretion system C-terminal sorting domain/Bacterial pre-peptidase C-terminal domain